MSEAEHLTRRALLAAPAIAAFVSTTACAQTSGSRALVAYMTRSGNTQVIADTLHRELKADILQFRTAKPYPEDYEAHVAQAAAETKAGLAPPLAARVENIGSYDVIFLGFPIWGMTAPPPLRSFLKAHDLRGKTIRPFVTHGGYGVGEAPSVLSGLAPGARIETPFVMECDQEKRTLNQVRQWIGRA